MNKMSNMYFRKFIIILHHKKLIRKFICYHKKIKENVSFLFQTSKKTSKKRAKN